MKKLNIIVSILTIMFFTSNAFSQCDSDQFLDNCSELLDDYTYVKVFNVKTDKKITKVEYSYVFSKDHEYRLCICGNTANNGKKLIVNLYDRNKVLISSSYYKPQNLHVQKIGYKCSATGVYYIEAYFEGSAENCGIIILGFQKATK